MGPTHRLDVKDLDIVPVDAQTCRTLVEQSGAHLRSAQMLREVDAEGATRRTSDACAVQPGTAGSRSQQPTSATRSTSSPSCSTGSPGSSRVA